MVLIWPPGCGSETLALATYSSPLHTLPFLIKWAGGAVTEAVITVSRDKEWHSVCHHRDLELLNQSWNAVNCKSMIVTQSFPIDSLICGNTRITSICWLFSATCGHSEAISGSHFECAAAILKPTASILIDILWSFWSYLKLSGQVSYLSLVQHESWSYMSFVMTKKVSIWFPIFPNLISHLVDPSHEVNDFVSISVSTGFSKHLTPSDNKNCLCIDLIDSVSSLQISRYCMLPKL